MATLTLKNVPEELVRRLKQEARQNRRSLNQETLARLEGSLARRQRDVEATITSLRRLHRTMADLPPIDDDFIDRAKGEGRL
jgi:GTP1/Obg family GTP-binding protein